MARAVRRRRGRQLRGMRRGNHRPHRSHHPHRLVACRHYHQEILHVNQNHFVVKMNLKFFHVAFFDVTDDKLAIGKVSTIVLVGYS